MFSDKITKAIAEAAKTVMDTTNETWPDAASTSIYADKAGKAPISDMETGADHEMTDEAASGNVSAEFDYVTDDDGEQFVKNSAKRLGLNFKTVSQEGPGGGWPVGKVSGPKDAVKKFLIKHYGDKETAADAHEDIFGGAPDKTVSAEFDYVTDDDGEQFVKNSAKRLGLTFKTVSQEGPGGGWPVGKVSGPKDAVKKFLIKHYGDKETAADAHEDIFEGMITDEEIQEALKKSQPASEWITDFVNSKDAKFKGKSKGERINMALGAYYAAQNESVSEGVEEPRSQGEKNFKAAHTILKMSDPNADRQTGTEAMDQKAKPVLPIGKTFSKAEDIDGEKYNDKDFADIKASGKRATAPKASAPGKFTYADGCDVYNKTAAAIKKSAQGAASAPKASGSKQSGAQSAEKVSNTAPNGKLSAEYPKANQKGSDAMPKGLKETALATLLGEDAIEEGLFDNIKALGSNVAGAVKSKVAAVGQKIGDEIEKAKKQGNAAELARLQARANQLKTNLPADHADAPAGASVAQYKSDPKAFVAQTTKNLADKNITSDQELFNMLKNWQGNPTQGAAPLILPIIQAEIKKRGLKAGAPVTGAASAAAKPVSGAGAVAQKAAQAKLTKMSTSQLQASLARIQGLLKQRGVTEEVSFDEAFEFLGESLINEAMSNFDKQFADDNEKALKQIISGQGTESIDSRLLPQLNKFITSYGDDLKKYFGLPIQDKEVNEAAEMSDEDRDDKVSAIFKRFGIQDTNYEQDLDKAIEDLSKKSRIAAAQVKSLLKDSVNEAPYTPEYLGTGEEGSSMTNKGGSLASDKIENSVVVALTDLQEVLDRCLGNVPRTASYANPRISVMIQKVHQNLADVCEKLESEE